MNTFVKKDNIPQSIYDSVYGWIRMQEKKRNLKIPIPIIFIILTFYYITHKFSTQNKGSLHNISYNGKIVKMNKINNYYNYNKGPCTFSLYGYAFYFGKSNYSYMTFSEHPLTEKINITTFYIRQIANELTNISLAMVYDSETKKRIHDKFPIAVYGPNVCINVESVIITYIRDHIGSVYPKCRYETVGCIEKNCGVIQLKLYRETGKLYINEYEIQIEQNKQWYICVVMEGDCGGEIEIE